MRKFLENIQKFNFTFLKSLNFEKKIILLFTGSLAVFFLVIGFIINSRITENNINNIEKSTREELITRDNAILSIERSLKGKIKLLSKDDVLLSEPDEIAHSLQVFAKDNGEFSQVFFGKNDGEFVETPKTARETSFDPRNTVWYKDASAAGEGNMMIVTAPFQGIDGAAKVGFYNSVNFYGYPNGVIGGTVNFAELIKMSGNADKLIILDNDDNIVFDSETTGNLFQKLNKVNMGDLSLVGQKNDGISKVSVSDKNMFAVVYKSDATKLKYIKLIDYNEALSSANSVKYIVIIAFMAMLGVSFVLSKLLYKDIKKSFMNIEAKTEAIGEGKLDEITTATESSDEVGRLSFAFKKMAGNVKSRLMTMETESQNLRALIKNISDKNELIKETAKNLSNNLHDILYSSESNFIKIHNIADEAENISANLEDMSNLQKRCKSDIMTLVQNADIALKRLKEETEKNETELKREKEKYEADFKEKSKSLKDALQKIADDASEISLMAFSAALEAARGKNEKSKFAKIAEDIRKLAESMSKSATAGLKGVETLEPKILENTAVNAERELSDALASAKNIEENLNSTEAVINRLETFGNNAKATANEALNSESDFKTATDNAVKYADEVENAIYEIKNMTEKTFENL